MLLKKLVIADDDDSIAHLVGAALGDAGFLCLRARDGRVALDLVRTEQPDAVVLDVMMPEIDGIDVCRQLKADVVLSRVPVLMLTSLSDVDHRVAGLDAGADDYLGKPFDMRELAARVKALIRQSRRERDRNPVTNLPGAQAVEDRVDELLRGGAPFALLYIDVENFRAFADAAGFVRANAVIAQAGRAILDECRDAATPAPFVGHVGGDDFIVLCAPELGEPLAADLAGALREIIAAEDPDPAAGERPPLAPSVAVVSVAGGAYEDHEALAREVARVKASVRARTGSGLIPLPR